MNQMIVVPPQPASPPLPDDRPGTTDLEDRLRHMTEASRPASGPPLLTADEWQSLKTICKTAGAGKI